MTSKTLTIDNLYNKNIINKTTKTNVDKKNRIVLIEKFANSKYQILDKTLNLDIFPDQLTLSDVNLSKYYFNLNPGGSTHIQKVAHQVSVFDNAILQYVNRRNEMFLTYNFLNNVDKQKMSMTTEFADLYLPKDGYGFSNNQLYKDLYSFSSLTNKKKHQNLFALTTRLVTSSHCPIFLFDKNRKVFINSWLSERQKYLHLYIDEKIANDHKNHKKLSPFKNSSFYFGHFFNNRILSTIFPNLGSTTMKNYWTNKKFIKIFPKINLNSNTDCTLSSTAKCYPEMENISYTDKLIMRQIDMFNNFLEDYIKFYIPDDKGSYTIYQLLNLAYYINILHASVHKCQEQKTQKLFTPEILKKAKNSYAILTTPFSRNHPSTNKVCSDVLYLNKEDFVYLIKISHVVSCMVGRPLSPVYNYLMSELGNEKI